MKEFLLCIYSALLNAGIILNMVWLMENIKGHGLFVA